MRALFGLPLLASLCLTLPPLDAGAKKETTPREAISQQFDLLKAGKADELKAWFTDRLKDKITPEAVKAGQKGAAKFTLDDLVHEVAKGEFKGKETAKIKMKNGRTLTTLIKEDGKWLADTIWFK
jgi:hypothetical protein